MTSLLQASLGALIAAGLILLGRAIRLERQDRLWAIALCIAAIIYVGFAAFGGAALSWLLLELGGVIIYTTLAFLSLRTSPLLLAFAWFAHITWDTIVNAGPPDFMPAWYPPVCIGFDLVIAAFIALEHTRRRRPV